MSMKEHNDKKLQQTNGGDALDMLESGYMLPWVPFTYFLQETILLEG